MRGQILAVIAGACVVLGGVSVAAAASSTAAPECAAPTDSSSLAEHQAWESCRFDALQAAISAPASTATVTERETSTVTEQVPTTVQALTTVMQTIRTTVRTTVPGPTVTKTVTAMADPSTPETSAPQTSEPPTTEPTEPPSQGGFPDASNTGVPVGTKLTAYSQSGVCRMNKANEVVDGKIMNCDVLIQAKGITIRNSEIHGRVASYNNSDAPSSVTITDSLVDGGNQETYPSVSYENVTLLRVNVIGGQHSVQCNANCVVTDSWLHDQYLPRTSAGHVNAFISNGGSNFTLTHNTLHCTPQPTNNAGACTADASLFGDFSPISNATFTNNLFKANSTGAGYCMQAGYNPGKKYPNSTGVVVKNNVFERGSNGKCGVWGPVTAFNSSASGNQWTGNTFDDGATINP